MLEEVLVLPIIWSQLNCFMSSLLKEIVSDFTLLSEDQCMRCTYMYIDKYAHIMHINMCTDAHIQTQIYTHKRSGDNIHCPEGISKFGSKHR